MSLKRRDHRHFLWILNGTYVVQFNFAKRSLQINALKLYNIASVGHLNRLRKLAQYCLWWLL